jgi:hypothetical protein
MVAHAVTAESKGTRSSEACSTQAKGPLDGFQKSLQVYLPTGSRHYRRRVADTVYAVVEAIVATGMNS